MNSEIPDGFNPQEQEGLRRLREGVERGQFVSDLPEDPNIPPLARKVSQLIEDIHDEMTIQSWEQLGVFALRYLPSLVFAVIGAMVTGIGVEVIDGIVGSPIEGTANDILLYVAGAIGFVLGYKYIGGPFRRGDFGEFIDPNEDKHENDE